MEHQGPLTSPIYSPSTKRNDSLYECCVLGFTQHLLLLSSHSIFLTTWRLSPWIHSWRNQGFGLSQATSENGWGRREIRSPHCQVDTAPPHLELSPEGRGNPTLQPLVHLMLSQLRGTGHNSTSQLPQDPPPGSLGGSRETGGDTALTNTRHGPSLPLRHHLSTRPASTGKPRGDGQVHPDTAQPRNLPRMTAMCEEPETSY